MESDGYLELAAALNRPTLIEALEGPKRSDAVKYLDEHIHLIWPPILEDAVRVSYGIGAERIGLEAYLQMRSISGEQRPYRDNDEMAAGFHRTALRLLRESTGMTPFGEEPHGMSFQGRRISDFSKR